MKPCGAEAVFHNKFNAKLHTVIKVNIFIAFCTLDQPSIGVAREFFCHFWLKAISHFHSGVFQCELFPVNIVCF